ncbi:MAG: hypothetical protein Q4G21_00475 [Dermabacter sp.]|nr:hypothetical protein [Dermabacter sp.]
MRSLYERLSQNNLIQRPASRRTVLTLSVLTPLALITAGALGVRHALPGAGATRERAALVAAIPVMETVGSLVSFAWSALPEEDNEDLEASARDQLDLSMLLGDSTSRAEIFTVFHEVRARALEGVEAGTISSSSELSSSSMWTEPRVNLSPEGQSEGVVLVYLSSPVQCLVDQSVIFEHTYEFDCLVETGTSGPFVSQLVRTA